MANKYTGSLIKSPDVYVEKFRFLASQIGPNFSYLDAVKAQAWSTHIGIKLQLSYNDMRKLAGLPLLRLGRPAEVRTKKPTEYVPVYPKKSKGPLVNRCLWINPDDSQCEKMLPKGQHFCPRCKKIKEGY